MTDKQLREAVARAMCAADFDLAHDAPDFFAYADAAIALMRPVIRAQALEEAAKVAYRAPVMPMCETSAERIAAAIRALKEKPNE